MIILTLSDVTQWLHLLFLTSHCDYTYSFWRHTVITLTLSDVTLWLNLLFLTSHSDYTYSFWRHTVITLTLSDVTLWLHLLFLTSHSDYTYPFWRHTVITLTLSDVTLQSLVAPSTPTDGECGILWVLDAELCSSSEAPVCIATIYSTAKIRYSLCCNEKLCMCAWRCNVNSSSRFIYTEWERTRNRHGFQMDS